jgi:hypothetical protein
MVAALGSSAAGGAELPDLEALFEYDELGSSNDDGYEFATGIGVGRDP